MATQAILDIARILGASGGTSSPTPATAPAPAPSPSSASGSSGNVVNIGGVSLPVDQLLGLVLALLQPAAQPTSGASPGNAPSASSPSLLVKLLPILLPIVVQLIMRLLDKPKVLPPPAAGPLPPGMQIPGDEDIKAPVGKPPSASERGVPVRAELKCLWMQAQRSRFPEMYTSGNPFGLFDDDFKRAVLAGTKNLPNGSKLRFDMKAFDAQGRELLPDDVERLGYAGRVRWEIVCDGKLAWFEGDGRLIPDPGAAGQMVYGYSEGGDGFMGTGISNYSDTKGFCQVMKAFGEGRVDAVRAVVMDTQGNRVVQTNDLSFRVS